MIYTMGCHSKKVLEGSQSEYILWVDECISEVWIAHIYHC